MRWTGVKIRNRKDKVFLVVSSCSDHQPDRPPERQGRLGQGRRGQQCVLRSIDTNISRNPDGNSLCDTELEKRYVA